MNSTAVTAVLSIEQRFVKDTLPAVTAVPSIDQQLVDYAQPSGTALPGTVRSKDSPTSASPAEPTRTVVNSTAVTALLSIEQSFVKDTTAASPIDQNFVEDAEPTAIPTSPIVRGGPFSGSTSVDTKPTTASVRTDRAEPTAIPTSPSPGTVRSKDSLTSASPAEPTRTVVNKNTPSEVTAVPPTELRFVKIAPSVIQPDAVSVTEGLEPPVRSDAYADQPHVMHVVQMSTIRLDRDTSTSISDDIEHVTRAEVPNAFSDPVHIIDPRKPSDGIHVPRATGPDPASEADVVYAYARRLVGAWCPRDALSAHSDALEQWVRMGLYDDQYRAATARLASYHKRSSSVMAAAYNGAPRDCDGNIEDLGGILEPARRTVEYPTIPVAYTIYRRLAEAKRIESMIADAYRKAPRNRQGKVHHLERILARAAADDVWTRAPRNSRGDLLDIERTMALHTECLGTESWVHVISPDDSKALPLAAVVQASTVDSHTHATGHSHQVACPRDSLPQTTERPRALPEAPSSNSVRHVVRPELGVTDAGSGQQPMEKTAPARIGGSLDTGSSKGNLRCEPDRYIVIETGPDPPVRGYADASYTTHERDIESRTGSLLVLGRV